MATVRETIESSIDRMLSDGVHYRDLIRLQETIVAPEDWCGGWLAAASLHERAGRRAREDGFGLTAGRALARAALYCHFAQGYFTEDRPAEKARAEQRKRHLFLEAAALLEPPLERVEIPFRGERAPGYLRRPPGPGRHRCVLLFGGLDSTKEDSLSISDPMIERGLATLAFDGPGQGEFFDRMKLIPDYEAIVSAAIDWLATRAEIDAQRIGIVGRSTGGHWAMKAAAADARVAAAVAWGLAYHVRNMPELPASVQSRWLRACGCDSVAAALRYFATYDLAGVAERITCPVMIVQGGQDAIVPPGGAERVEAEARGLVEILSWPDSGHCCHDRSHLTKPAIADFLARHLGTAGR